jgi:hypothetical protein
MSTSCIQPNRPNKFLRYLAVRLALDEMRRRPPISLPGRPASTREVVKAAPPPKVRPPPQLDCASQLCRREAEPEDGCAPYSRAELLKMDRRFRERLERAFALGLESRASAAGIDPRALRR